MFGCSSRCCREPLMLQLGATMSLRRQGPKRFRAILPH